MVVGGAPASRAAPALVPTAHQGLPLAVGATWLTAQAHAHPAASASVGPRRYFHFESSRRYFFVFHQRAQDLFSGSALLAARDEHTHFWTDRSRGRVVEELDSDVAIVVETEGLAISTHFCVVENASQRAAVPSEHRTFFRSREE